MRRSVAALSIAIQVIAVVVLVFVVRQNARLRRLVAAKAVVAQRFAAGDPLGAIPVSDLTGRTRSISLERGSYVVVIVQPSCGVCEKTVAGASGRPGIVVLSLGELDETRALAERAGILESTFMMPRESLPRFGGRFTYYPQVLLVENGVVTRTCIDISRCASLSTAELCYFPAHAAG